MLGQYCSVVMEPQTSCHAVCGVHSVQFPVFCAYHGGFQGATVAVMAGTAGAASLGASPTEEPVKPTVSKKKHEMQ